MVKNNTFWTPAAHVKVTFSLFLERISKKYESFECFLPGVGKYPTVDQNNSFIFNIYIYYPSFENYNNIWFFKWLVTAGNMA